MMTSIIFVLLLLGVIIWQIYPAINAPHSSEFTTQDGIEDVITKKITKDVDNKNNIELENKLLNVDFVEKEKCPTHETKGVRQLSEHIKDVIQKEPTKVRSLKKRERKTVSKTIA